MEPQPRQLRGPQQRTLATTDATGGWIVPNALVDEIVKPALLDNPYPSLVTVVPGVRAFQIDIPMRTARPARMTIASRGATKENVDLAYNGYTATMYTLARVHDLANQFLKQSAGAADAFSANRPWENPIRVRGIPLIPDPSMTASDDLIVGRFKSLKVYFGDTFRIDSSSVAGNRWDENETGFRGEFEMGLDARAAVFTGNFTHSADVTP
jgi:hypothetical protein